MSTVISALSRHGGIAFSDGENEYGYAEFFVALKSFSAKLRNDRVRVVGIAMDNSPLWALFDLAAIDAGIVCVPLPGFFSPAQLIHVMLDSGVDLILTDRADEFCPILEEGGFEILGRKEGERFGRKHSEIRLESRPAELPPGTAKVTYTSGTTGNPKGVCLSMDSIERVARSLLDASRADSQDRYLSVLPLSTLLENIGGIYVPLLAGARCNLPSLSRVGLEGAAKLDPLKMGRALADFRATCAILTPQLLQAVCALVGKGLVFLPEMRFLAVGGAPVSLRLLDSARAAGLPVFEGYGLSECASVLSLNTERENRPGSVGKPLPHVQMKFAEDGEILAKGAVMLGYCGHPAEFREGFWPTGDTGYLDGDGYLHLTGRKKNIFITSFGRNVAPEWVERELTHHAAIMQAVVFGESRPWSVAVIVPRDPDAIGAAVLEANEALPDYARVGKWLVADAPFLPDNGLLTANGRLKREAIWPIYRERIEALYEEKA